MTDQIVIDSQIKSYDLSHFALIKISGQDAESFLQAQICADLAQLEESGWWFSAWCLPNGRVIATFIVFNHTDSYYLILPSALKDKVLTRLAMFVLRSDVSIADASNDYAMIGLSDDKSPAILHIDSLFHRYIVIGPMQIMNQALELINETATTGQRASWSLMDIQTGLPWILEATTERFLPQSLNLDLRGGVSYHKGCYPGQEVLARLHYRGEVKKRLYKGSVGASAMPGPGDRLVTSPERRVVGDILDAERNSEELVHFLAVVEIASARSKALILEGQDETSRITLESATNGIS